MTITVQSHGQRGEARAVGLAVSAMVAMQLGAALSRPFVTEIGAPAFTWMRMCAAALMLFTLFRPRLRGRSRHAILSAILLGTALAVTSTATYAAVAHLPLGLVASISFLGPLGVAVFGARSLLGVGLALLAAVGVALCVGTAHGNVDLAWRADPLGLTFAGIAAGGWAAYILLTRRVGSLFSGMEGLCLSFASSALVLAPFGLGSLHQMPPLATVLAAGGVAVLAPILTCGAEMAALRRLGAQSFGVLMSLEPVIALLIGLVLLHQFPNTLQVIGTVCIAAASALTVTLTERPQSKK